MTMALLSSPSAPAHLSTTTLSASSTSSKPHLAIHKPYSHLLTKSKKTHLSISLAKAATDNGAGIATSNAAVVTDEKSLESPASADNSSSAQMEKNEEVLENPAESAVKKFTDPRWVNGTWDLNKFRADGKADWDAVIDAEASRRKWLEAYPESSNNEEPVMFDTSIIPWWAWIKKFHLPEAELLNGRAAMVGFFMSYFVDSLTGLGVVDQMSNFFCKTLLFAAVLGVLLIRKNEDVQTLKKLFDESTFYDKQWQATWQDETTKKN